MMKTLFDLSVLFVCTSVSAYYPATPQIVYPSGQVVYPTQQTVYPAQTVIYPSRQVVHNSRRIVRVVRRRVIQTVPCEVHEEPPQSASKVRLPVFVAPQSPVAPQLPDMLSLSPIVEAQTSEAKDAVELRAEDPVQSTVADEPVGVIGESDDEASFKPSARKLVEKCREQLESVPKWGLLGISVLVLLIAIETWNAKRR